MSRFFGRSNRDNRPTNVGSNIGNDDISTTIENINTLTDSVSRAQDDKWAFYSRLEQMLNNLNITKGVLYEHIVAAIELIKNLRKSKDEFTRKNEEQIEELRTTKSALEKSKQSLSQIKNQLSDVNKNKLKLKICLRSRRHVMRNITLEINGKKVQREISDHTLLSTFIRDHLNMTGTHVGCDTSQCGACVVHVDGKSLKSCTTLSILNKLSLVL